MASTKTAEELVHKVASILGKRVAGEALGQPEYDTIDGNIDAVFDEIEEIVYIGDRDEIPGRLFYTLARLVAVHSASDFSAADVDLAQVTKHENRLRYLVSTDPTFETTKAVYY